MKTPTFSVLLPTNRLDLLFVDALNSVGFDLSEDAEVLVVLNGEAIEEARKFDWSTFEVANLRILNSHAPGLVAALNLGLSEARGEFIARMDADDVTLPGRFGVQLAFLRENPSYAAVGSQFIEVCAHGKTGRRSHLPRRLRNNPWPPLFTRMAHPTVMFRKDTVQAVGGYRADFLHAEDQDLWLRLLKVSQLGNLNQVFLKYRKHSNQVSVENIGQQQQGLIRTYLWNSGLAAYGGYLSEAESPRDYKELIRNSPELGWKRSITLCAAVDLWSFSGTGGSGFGKLVTQAMTRPHIALLFLWVNRMSLFSAIQGSARCETCGV